MSHEKIKNNVSTKDNRFFSEMVINMEERDRQCGASQNQRKTTYGHGTRKYPIIIRQDVQPYFVKARLEIIYP